MKKTTKKLLAVAMAVPMAISACSFGALADGETTITPNSSDNTVKSNVSVTSESAWTVTFPSTLVGDQSMTLGEGKTVYSANLGDVKVASNPVVAYGKVLKITYASGNSKFLKADGENTNSIAYVLATSDTDTTTGITGSILEVASNTATVTTQALYANAIQDNVTKVPADTYKDTITFTVKEDVASP